MPRKKIHKRALILSILGILIAIMLLSGGVILVQSQSNLDKFQTAIGLETSITKIIGLIYLITGILFGIYISLSKFIFKE